MESLLFFLVDFYLELLSAFIIHKSLHIYKTKVLMSCILKEKYFAVIVKEMQKERDRNNVIIN